MNIFYDKFRFVLKRPSWLSSAPMALRAPKPKAASGAVHIYENELTRFEILLNRMNEAALLSADSEPEAVERLAKEIFSVITSAVQRGNFAEEQRLALMKETSLLKARVYELERQCVASRQELALQRSKNSELESQKRPTNLFTLFFENDELSILKTENSELRRSLTELQMEIEFLNQNQFTELAEEQRLLHEIELHKEELERLRRDQDSSPTIIRTTSPRLQVFCLRV